MKNLKLEIELVPKGAWGNNLRETLTKKEWNHLRDLCLEKADNTCKICGFETQELDAHEVWEYNIDTKTQTLKDIIALCSRCHGVKHMRNSERLGYGDNAKRHFCKINNCSDMTLANHMTEAELLFEERNSVYRWTIVASLDKFGGKGMEIKQRNIPMIKSEYETVEWETLSYKEKQELFKRQPTTPAKMWFTPPKIDSIKIDNYLGTITVICNDANKIDWFLNREILKTKYNVVGKFKTELKVENLNGGKLQFKLTGDGGETSSKVFEIITEEVL